MRGALELEHARRNSAADNGKCGEKNPCHGIQTNNNLDNNYLHKSPFSKKQQNKRGLKVERMKHVRVAAATTESMRER